MKIKEVLPSNFLFFRATTTVAELAGYLPMAQRLYEEAVVQNLRINGPIHWHYIGFNGIENSPFTLEICLPVQQLPTGYDGPFHVKRTEPFRCISIVHEGGWTSIPDSYAKAFHWLGEQKLEHNGVNRELYLHVDLELLPANVTEIQVGIK